MQRIKPHIGWYCPFSFPPLQRNRGIEAAAIEAGRSEGGFIGTVRLCGKLAAVQGTIASGSLAGLIMVNCCNLSQSMYEYFRIIYPEADILLMEIPRKADSMFGSEMSAQWKSISDWLDRFDGDKEADGIRYSGIDSGDWCSLSGELAERLGSMTEEEMVQSLLREVCCPRIIIESGKDGRIGMKAENVEKECVLQSYYKAILSHSAREAYEKR